MIIPNGHIVFGSSVVGGVDSDGYPTAAVEAWGNAVECQYLPNNNLQAHHNGEAITAQSYVVYIEQMDIPSERVKLLDRSGKEIGQYSLLSVEHLEAVCQTKLTL